MQSTYSLLVGAADKHAAVIDVDESYRYLTNVQQQRVYDPSVARDEFTERNLGKQHHEFCQIKHTVVS